MTRASAKACVVVRDMVVQSAPVVPQHMAIIETWPEDLRDQWEERAAIMQHDGRLERNVAERNAFEDILTRQLGAPLRPTNITQE